MSRGSDGRPFSFWFDDAMFGDFIYAFKIEGEPELIMAKMKVAAKS